MVRQGNPGTNGSRPKVSAGGKSARKPADGHRLSPVYRRRRLFVGVIVLLVMAVAFGGFAAVSAGMKAGGQASGGPADAAGRPAPTASPGHVRSPGSDADPHSRNGCDQNLVTVSAATDKPAYAAGEIPLLTLKVTNGNKVPCEVNIGTSQMEYLITSGSDRIFSSKDCQSESSDLVKTIAPGQSETANFQWQRNRTVQGCDPVQAKPGAGGAYYVFTASLANKTSPKAVFQLN